MLKVLPTGIFQKTLADGRCPGCDISVCMIYLNCGVSCYSNHIGVGSNVVCSTLIGNARASTCGMDNTEVHAFLCLFVSKNLENTMSTLFNVTHQGECSPPRKIGLASNIPPGSSKDGVSMRYAPNPNKKWYVMRVTYHRERKAYDFLQAKGIEAYLPLRRKLKKINGKQKIVFDSLLPNFLFVYTTPDVIKTCTKNTKELFFLNHYYNHFETDSSGKNPPLTVSYKAMMNFIRITSVESEHVWVVAPQQCHYKSGDMVRVTEGDFKGVEGRVARIAGQQKVVVEIKGVCLVSTAYIPSAFIEKI